MKTKEEIEELAKEYAGSEWCNPNFPYHYPSLDIGYKNGYIQAQEDMQPGSKWINHKTPPGNDKKVWCFSKKDNTVVMGYKNEYGWFDTKGAGISLSMWCEIVLPEPPKSNQ